MPLCCFAPQREDAAADSGAYKDGNRGGLRYGGHSANDDAGIDWIPAGSPGPGPGFPFEQRLTRLGGDRFRSGFESAVIGDGDRQRGR